MSNFKYTPTPLMLPTSHYDKRRADYAVELIPQGNIGVACTYNYFYSVVD